MQARLIDINVSELEAIIKRATEPLLARIDKLEASLDKEKVNGIRGLAEYYNCSVRTIQRANKRGRFKKAATQISPRCFIYDINKLPKEL